MLAALSTRLTKDFYPRPPRGGRLVVALAALSGCEFLSTPSARRATSPRGVSSGCGKFLSTPSARRATRSSSARRTATSYFYPRPPRGGRRVVLIIPDLPESISIHALREEGDSWTVAPTPTPTNISIHALREEGDMGGMKVSNMDFIFLSTPSARRATAKTETKSLFSNKLYNILHEFRRALIYNGSKSYPNRAK